MSKKNVYAVKRIYVGDNPTTTEYWDRIMTAVPFYCNGIAELEESVGGKLNRYRAGYGGRIGNIEFVAQRVR